MGTLVNRVVIATGIIIALVIAVVLLTGSEPDDQSWFTVDNGNFEIMVKVTGELEAENSVSINAPQQLQSRNIRLRQIPIHDMVPEGTEVEEGDWVATLDRTEAELALRDLEDQMLREEAQYKSAILDTTIRLSNLRDELINIEHAIEERKLALEQSTFEPPATIRQAEIDLERAGMDFEQARDNYLLYQQQSVEAVREAAINLERRVRRFRALEEVMEQFVITSPRSGMVIYHREWNGGKRTVGSTIHPRDLTVAILPDLGSLVSRAWVNEIDINDIQPGQTVRIGVDSYPDRTYTGRVTEVSNVGHEMPNTDVKVFEVLISLDQNDYVLRPAMTTSNIIVTASYENVNYVPLAAIHEQDEMSYVYTSNGTRQVVITGPSNDNYIIIEQGLESGDLVYLTEPENYHDFEFAGNELLSGGAF